MINNTKRLKIKKNSALKTILTFPWKIIGCVSKKSYFYLTLTGENSGTTEIPNSELNHLFLHYLKQGLRIVEILNKLKSMGFPMTHIVSQYHSYLIRRNLLQYLTA